MPNNTEDNLLSEIRKCKLCRSCEDVCSIFLTLKKYAPHEKLETVKNLAASSEKPLNWESVFFCTKCEACDVKCPEEIPITMIIDLGRRLCVDKWGLQYTRQKDIIANIFKFGNPFGNAESRTEWLNASISNDSNTLLHLGCMISYPLNKMGQSIIKILKKLNIDFTISPNERCCGYFCYNTGNHQAAQQIIDQNVEEFDQYEHIITTCAGCYTFLKDYYPLKSQLKHVIEVIFEKVEELGFIEKLKEKTAVFQDSCHISRLHKIIEPPRKLLEAMKFQIYEFDKALCCGADGGMRIINKELALEVGKGRLLEAKEKSNLLLTLCPFCIHNFREAAETYAIDIQIASIFEILEDLIP